MSPEVWRDRVAGMIEDIRRVESFITGMDRAAFARDERTVFAVAYAFVRLGEAVGSVPDDVKAAHPTVPWGDIRHFRNFMIHVYHAVDPIRLYDTALADLPGLADLLAQVIATPPNTPAEDEASDGEPD